MTIWHTSSYSGNNASNSVEVGQDHTAWRKSTYSGNNASNCVEVGASGPAAVLVRDTKNRTGGVLAFGSRAWERFIHSTAGELPGLV
ncbi:MAG TPA: DUF397 domain-containing protein [Pseudonocardiaceae bacterium]